MLQLVKVLAPEALKKDSTFFTQVFAGELASLGFKAVEDVVTDKGFMDVLLVLYKCYMFGVGKAEEWQAAADS